MLIFLRSLMQHCLELPSHLLFPARSPPDKVSCRRTGAIRTQTIILSLMAVFMAVFVGLGVYQLYQSSADAENGIRLEAQSGARIVAANVEWVMETARQVLRRVDDSIDDPEDA